MFFAFQGDVTAGPGPFDIRLLSAAAGSRVFRVLDLQALMSKWAGGHLILWRWNSLSSCVAVLCEREGALKQCWDPAKFGYGSAKSSLRAADNEMDAQSGGGGSDAKFVTNVATSARSARFWSYLGMVDLVAGFSSELCGWTEGCPCHPGKRDQHARQQCHCRGRRAPELAASVLGDMIANLQAASVSKLCKITAGLSDVDKLSVHEDWICAFELRMNM